MPAAGRKGAAPFKGTERFVIEDEIGRGGMGVVYAARDVEHGSRVALKTLARFDPTGLIRFKREFRALADTGHRNLVELHELVAEEQPWFFTMELIDGVDFLSWVRQVEPASSDWVRLASSASGEEPEETLDTRVTPHGMAAAAAGRRNIAEPVGDLARLRAALRQIVEGIAALHDAGHLHRDIKPSNVLVERDGGRVVVLDFGVITQLARGSRDNEELVGTPAYMAPEQATEVGSSPASDWYSVGVMLFEALTGQRPFSGAGADILAAKKLQPAMHPASIYPDADETLAGICADLLERDPAARPGGAALIARLDGQERAKTSRRTMEAGTSSPKEALLGRADHLRSLDRELTAARDGRPSTVFVHGSSGMGKSWLVQTFLNGIPDDTLILQGRCYERETMPYKALDSLVDDLCRHLATLSEAEGEALIGDDVAALARAFPVLRRVEAVMKHRQQLGARDPLELRKHAFAALRRIFSRLARRSPLVLFIDDIQWGDVDSAPLLAGLMRPPDPPPLLLIMAYRSEELAQSKLLRTLRDPRVDLGRKVRTVDIEVDALSQRDARRLARSLLVKAGAMSAGASAAIARESGGCPYFIDELVRYAHSRAAGAAAADAQPDARPTLDEVICSRVNELADDARQVLELVAVAGRPLTQEVVERAANVEKGRRPVINQLRVANLVRTTGGRSDDMVETFHDRIGAAVRASLSSERLADSHRRLALSLQATRNPDSDALVRHFAAAGDRARASEYAAAAAEHAAESLAFERAAELYRIALEHPELETSAARELKLSLANALGNAGRGAEAAGAHLELVEGASVAEALTLRRDAAMYYLTGGHFDDGIATMRDVLPAVGLKMARTQAGAILSIVRGQVRLRIRGFGFEPRDPSQLSAERLCAIDACWAMSVGLSMIDTLRGAAFVHRHSLLALAAGEPSRVVRALTAEIAVRSAIGPRARAQVDRLVARARPLVDELGDRELEGWFLTSVGFAEYQVGNFAVARDYSARAVSIFRHECAGLFWVVTTVETHLCWELYYLGELRSLASRVRGRLAEASERGDLYTSVNLRVGLTNIVWLCDDEPDAARRHAQEALDSWSREGFHLQHHWAALALASCDLYVGDGTSARDRVEEMWPALKRSQILRIHLVRIEAWHLRARCLLATAVRPSRAPVAVDRIATRLEREKVGYGDALAALLRAGCANIRGDSEAALEFFARAERGFRTCDMALYAAVAQRRRGEFMGEGGAEFVAAADRWMEGQGVVNPERMTAMFAPLGPTESG